MLIEADPKFEQGICDKELVLHEVEKLINANRYHIDAKYDIWLELNGVKVCLSTIGFITRGSESIGINHKTKAGIVPGPLSEKLAWSDIGNGSIVDILVRTLLRGISSELLIEDPRIQVECLAIYPSCLLLENKLYIIFDVLLNPETVIPLSQHHNHLEAEAPCIATSHSSLVEQMRAACHADGYKTQKAELMYEILNTVPVVIEPAR